jgi:putative addiction module antidote
MEQNIVQIGNSTGIIIPKSLLKELDLELGDTVELVKDPITNSLIVEKKGAEKKYPAVTPEFLQILERINKRYGKALKSLANK